VTQVGRPPKPAHLRAIDGNPGKRAQDPAPVQAPVVREIDPPRHLDGHAAECWRTLQPQLARYVGLTELDLIGLELFCMSYGRYRLALDALVDVKEGVAIISTTYTTHGRNGKQHKMRPEYQQALAEADLMRKIAADYGLNPVARVRLKGIGQLGLPLDGDPLTALKAKYGAAGGEERAG
jgi:P27 family predicted phage terminase small subunit